MTELIVSSKLLGYTLGCFKSPLGGGVYFHKVTVKKDIGKDTGYVVFLVNESEKVVPVVFTRKNTTRSKTFDARNMNWNNVYHLVRMVQEQPIVLRIHKTMIEVIFQY